MLATITQWGDPVCTMTRSPETITHIKGTQLRLTYGCKNWSLRLIHAAATNPYTRIHIVLFDTHIHSPPCQAPCVATL